MPVPVPLNPAPEEVGASGRRQRITEGAGAGRPDIRLECRMLCVGEMLRAVEMLRVGEMLRAVEEP